MNNHGNTRDLLAQTDIVALRCFKAGVPFPAEWQTYAQNLRDIISEKSQPADLAVPPYPAGT